MQPDDLEISDLVVDYDPETLQRRPVRWRAVLEYFESRGNRTAARIVRSLPRRGEFLDDAEVDRILLVAHMELQRLEEEFLHGQRILDLVRAMVTAAELHGVPKPFRVVDVGCGLGYIVRWLTCFGGLGAGVELIGLDYNARFIRAAQALAEWAISSSMVSCSPRSVASPCLPRFRRRSVRSSGSLPRGAAPGWWISSTRCMRTLRGCVRQLNWRL